MPGVLLTATLCRVHVSTSMLSNPTAIFATARSRGAAARSSSSIFSVRRQIKPSLSATRRNTSALGGRSESFQYSTSQCSPILARGSSNKRCVASILGRSILALPPTRTARLTYLRIFKGTHDLAATLRAAHREFHLFLRAPKDIRMAARLPLERSRAIVGLEL